MRPLITLALVLAPASASADHQHGMVTGAGEGSSVSAGVSLIAAQFDTMDYGGDYQAVVPAMRWAGGRFAAAANIGIYRLHENGRELYGAGDAVAHGQARLVESGHASAGVALALSAPTGDHLDGLGMGHPMAMP